jgi:hypothetical protein
MRSCWNSNGSRNKEFDISDSMAILVLIISPTGPVSTAYFCCSNGIRELNLNKKQRAEQEHLGYCHPSNLFIGKIKNYKIFIIKKES